MIAAIQDPSKDTLPVRQLFTVRIGLRLTEASQTAMVLGQGARDAGAECDLIPDTTPGVGYMMIDGTAEPQRVRAFNVTDPDIADLATRFAPPGAQQGNAIAMLNDGARRGQIVNAPAQLPGVPDGIDHHRVITEMMRRACSPGFDTWWRRAGSVGFCANPIQLTGTDEFGRERTALGAVQ